MKYVAIRAILIRTVLVANFFLKFGAHMKIVFIVKVKILFLI
jgi:hypothetical protein